MGRKKLTKADDKVATVTLPTAIPIGSLVRYYKDGWYVGHFQGMEKKLAKIKPIAGFKSTSRCVKILLGDVELA